MVFNCAMPQCNVQITERLLRPQLSPFFLFFLRKEGVRNFFFFLDGDFEGEPSGDRTSSVLSGDLMVISMFSMVVLVVSLLTRWASSSSTSCISSLPFTMTGTSTEVKLLENSSWFSTKGGGWGGVGINYWLSQHWEVLECSESHLLRTDYCFDNIRIY